jgi:hypothetical protein
MANISALHGRDNRRRYATRRETTFAFATRASGGSQRLTASGHRRSLQQIGKKFSVPLQNLDISFLEES